MNMHLWQTYKPSSDPAPQTLWSSLIATVTAITPVRPHDLSGPEFGCSIRWQPKGQNPPQILFLVCFQGIFREKISLWARAASERGRAFMTDSSTHNYLRPSERCRLVLSTFQAPLVLQLISESCKDVIVNVFPALLLHQMQKHTSKTTSSKTWFGCRPPFLPGPLHFQFLLRSASPLMTNKRPAAPSQSRALPCPKAPQVSTNRQLCKNTKIRQGYHHRAQNTTSLSKLFVIWRFSEFRGVSWYFKRPSMNLPIHFGAYVNFSNNILRQRFHSLDMLHIDFICSKPPPILQLILLSLPQNFIRPTLALERWSEFFQFWFDTNNLAYKIRDPTVQRNYCDGQPLFLPKNNTEHVPTGRGRKGGSCNLSSSGILIRVELDRGLAVPEVQDTFLLSFCCSFSEGGSLNLEKLLK